MNTMRSGIFIWGQSFPKVLLSLCSAGLSLSLPSFPKCVKMFVTHPPSYTDTTQSISGCLHHQLQLGASESYSGTPTLEPQDSAPPWPGCVAAWNLLQRPDPTLPPLLILVFQSQRRAVARRPLLCHWTRAEIPLTEKAGSTIAQLTSQSNYLVKALLFWSDCSAGPSGM